jgi:hypothetical protein
MHINLLWLRPLLELANFLLLVVADLLLLWTADGVHQLLAEPLILRIADLVAYGPRSIVTLRGIGAFTVVFDIVAVPSACSVATAVAAGIVVATEFRCSTASLKINNRIWFGVKLSKYSN